MARNTARSPVPPCKAPSANPAVNLPPGEYRQPLVLPRRWPVASSPWCGRRTNCASPVSGMVLPASTSSSSGRGLAQFAELGGQALGALLGCGAGLLFLVGPLLGGFRALLGCRRTLCPGRDDVA